MGKASDYFENGILKGFELTFKGIQHDRDRYLDQLYQLAETGEISDMSISEFCLSYSQSAEFAQWAYQSYLDKRHFAAIEAFLTPNKSSFPIFRGNEMEKLQQLLELGERERVQRIWRTAIGHAKGYYWHLVQMAKSGFVYNPGDTKRDRDAQRNAWDISVRNEIDDAKSRILSSMNDYRNWMEKAQAPAAVFERIEEDILSIQTETRPKPKGKKDSRPMTEDVFWEIIETGLDKRLSISERIDAMADRLGLFKASAIRSFDKLLHEKNAQAYCHEIWALAYVLRGGCSDDSFDEFRPWLIMQGRAVFEACLKNANDFDAATYGQEAATTLYDVAAIAYDMSQGKAMLPPKRPHLLLTGKDWEEGDLPKTLPTVTKAVGWPI